MTTERKPTTVYFCKNCQAVFKPRKGKGGRSLCVRCASEPDPRCVDRYKRPYLPDPDPFNDGDSWEDY